MRAPRAWWRGRLIRRSTVVPERSLRATPLPPRYAIADASHRRSLRKVRRPKAAYAPFPAIAGQEVDVRRCLTLWIGKVQALGARARSSLPT